MEAHPEVLSFTRQAVPGRLLFLAESEGDGNTVLDVLKSGGHEVTKTSLSRVALTPGRSFLSTFDVVLVDLTNDAHGILRKLEGLSAAISIYNLRPRLLCFSFAHRNPQFELAVERCGARYARVGSPAILLDAIRLVIAETEALDTNGPCVQIVHRYSQGGGCAPGEEVSTILLAHRGNFHQLPLPIAQRLVFNFLADHRRIALDSSQIASGLTGGWFYRDHAANSGYRQLKKIRRPTVKVLIQRIREAFASTFAKTGLRFDPHNVLRSFPALGSRRVLYKLHADVRWHHSTDPRRP